MDFNEKWPFFNKMFITYNFFSSQDTEKLKTPLYFSRQEASKYVSGDLEKSILGLTPGQDFVHILRPYRKYVESKFKKCFPTHWGIWNKNPAGTPCKYKKSLCPPPPYCYMQEKDIQYVVSQ